MMERVRSFILEIARKPAVTRVMSRMLPTLDQLVQRLTRGKVTSVAGWLVPSLVLLSTGAKSGERREHTLMYVRDDDGAVVVVGTNFGGDNHPAWTYNLLAHPDATTRIDGRVEHVTAVPLTPAEQATRWPRFDGIYRGYASYRERIGDTREIRMFRLEPRP